MPHPAKRASGRGRASALMLLVLLLAACAAPPAPKAAGASAAPALQTIVVATAGPTAFNWGLYAAEAAGFYAAQGIILDWLVTESPPKTAQVVVSGDAQVGTIGSDLVVNTVEQGSSLAIVGAEMRAPLMSMIVARDVPSWDVLRGRSIGVSGPQVAEALFTQKLLARHGLAAGDVDLVTVGSSPERYAALLSGTLPAAMLTQPFDLMATSAGFRRLGDSTEIVTDYPFPSYTVRRDWAAANSDALVRFLRATRQGHQWLYQPANAGAAVALLVERTRSEESLARLTYEVLVQEKRLITPDAAADAAGMANVLALMVEQGRLPTQPPADKYLAPHYLELAAR